jgi:uncharacterized protein
MMKYLLLLMVIVLVIWFVRRPVGVKPVADSTRPKEADEMLRCSYCEVYLPRSEAILLDGKVFCCEQHRYHAVNDDP